MSVKAGQSRSGLSLIEVTIAMAVFAVLLIVMLGIFSRGFNYGRRIRMGSTANFLAQEMMERFTNASEVFPATQKLHDNITKQTFGGNYSDYQYQVNFTSPISYICPKSGLLEVHDNLALVNVTVYWQGQSGERKTSFVTYVANLSF